MIKRRSVLGALVAAAVGSQTLPLRALSAAETGKARTIAWRNWSGSQQCVPAARLVHPSEDVSFKSRTTAKQSKRRSPRLDQILKVFEYYE